METFPGVSFEENSYIRGNKLVVVWGKLSLVNLTIPDTRYILVSGSHDATQCAQDSIPTRALCLRKMITVNTSSSGCVFMLCEKSQCVCVQEDKVLHEYISINLRSVKESPSLTEIMYMIFLDAVFHRNVTKHKW